RAQRASCWRWRRSSASTGRRISRASPTASCPATAGPCAISKPVERRPWEATSISAITAGGRCTRFTPAAIGCPKCHRDQTDRWLTAQRARLLPCAYYFLTFTLPDALRPLARSHQKTVYGVLMKSAAAALLTLARDARYVGGRLGCLAVLHTWTR